MKSSKLTVKTKSKTYQIYFGNNILRTTGKLIKKNIPNVKKICIVGDNKIPKILYKKLTRSLKGYEIKIYEVDILLHWSLKLLFSISILISFSNK